MKLVSEERKLTKLLNSKKFSKVFIITGKKSYNKSGAKFFFNKILKNHKVSYFYKESFIPRYEELAKILEKISIFKPDIILAIGGGCVLDYAKISASIDINKLSKNKIRSNSCLVKKKLSRVIAIPTTAGSGAEITTNAVIYVDEKKYSLEGKVLKPCKCFLISKFFLSGSFKVKSSSGFDTIAQAIESLMSLKSSKKSEKYALESLKISLRYFVSFLEKPNRKNAYKMACASNLAGRAIDISKTTAPHAISYPFTTLFKIKHGHAVSLFFEDIILFNYKNLKKSQTSFNLSYRFKKIFKLFNVNKIDELYLKIKYLKKRIKLDDSLKKYNLKKNISKVLQAVNAKRLRNNPVPLNKKNITEIILNKV